MNSKRLELYEIECDYYGELLKSEESGTGNTKMHSDRATQWAKEVTAGTNFKLKQLAYEEDEFKFRFLFSDGAFYRFFYGKQLLEHLEQA
jgi:hypothetical protein